MPFETVERHFRNLDRYLEQLQVLAAEDQDAFLNDPIKIGAAKYYLQVAIESCLDIANHLIAREGWRAPSTYADAFAVLAEQDIIPKNFLSTMQKMARMRNRLVHLYWEVDAETLHQILRHNLDDFETYKRYIVRYLQTQ